MENMCNALLIETKDWTLYLTACHPSRDSCTYDWIDCESPQLITFWLSLSFCNLWFYPCLILPISASLVSNIFHSFLATLGTKEWKSWLNHNTKGISAVKRNISHAFSVWFMYAQKPMKTKRRRIIKILRIQVRWWWHCTSHSIWQVILGKECASCFSISNW